MGTDCGIAILKDKEFKRIPLDRYYIFDPNNYPTMTWLTEGHFSTWVDASFVWCQDMCEYDDHRLKYCLNWLEKVRKIIKENAGAEFAVYTDNDWDDDKVESYKTYDKN